MLGCGHSNETSSTILTNGTSCLVRSCNVTPGNEMVDDKAFQYKKTNSFIPAFLLFLHFCQLCCYSAYLVSQEQ